MSTRKRKIAGHEGGEYDSKDCDMPTTGIAAAPDTTANPTRTPRSKHDDPAGDLFSFQVYLESGDKFYDIRASGKILITTWGKVGTFGTVLEHGTCSEKATYDCLVEKVKEQKRKGYNEVGRPPLSERSPLTYEVRLHKNDCPGNTFYDKWFTVSQHEKHVFIRDGFHSSRFTTTNKICKTSDAARKLLDSTVTQALSKGYTLV
jgi:predicted DNA-binding WGR domain protein